VAWPSGKAEACKASIPSSNLGATFFLPFSIYMLTIVSTPIGNFQDITLRALDSLRQCDLILCEDTRHSKRLFIHFEISTPTRSYHQFNEAKECCRVIDELKAGKHICLVSDAGTPTISDPGSRLIKECILEQIKIDSVPGPCAAIHALTLCGLDTERFQFIGFLPKKETAIKKELLNILYYSGTSICYESPRRLINIATIIQKLDAERQIVVARELTKTYQEIIRGTPSEILQHFEKKDVKGEIVLLIAHNPTFASKFWREQPLEETLSTLEKTFSLSHMEAIKTLASLRDQPKREIYKLNESEKN
jgi:16S rRNA (cytidine1402-2'-O)-methyltransferase